MIFMDLNEENVIDAAKLFNDSIESNEMLYKKLSVESFKNTFLLNANNEINVISIISQDKNCFASGCCIKGENRAFVTMVVVRKKFRHRGLGTNIVNDLQERLLSIGNIQKIEIVFFNPINLEWIVPNTKTHDHPNAPGIDMSGQAYIFFKNMRYRDFAYQNSYYLALQNFNSSLKCVKTRETLLTKNIEICIYDKNKHHKMGDLLKDLDSPLWTRDISFEISPSGANRPIITASHEGKICGFTGPLDVQDSKRGYFAGIGVHSQYRGMGIANVLFDELCGQLKNLGAEYMTLFTGEQNPARNIYETVGFKIVRSWANMRKEI